MDSIHLSQMEFYAYHGAFPEEGRLGQRFMVDVVLFKDLREAGKTDDLRHTVNYDEVYREIAETVMKKRCYLIETVAERIAARVLTRFSVEGIRVRVEKSHPPIPGILSGVAVEIERYRGVLQRDE